MSDASDPRHADPERHEARKRVAPNHYCKMCKRTLPYAPGRHMDPNYTIGVAHVYQVIADRGVICSSALRPTYHLDEQQANFEQMELE